MAKETKPIVIYCRNMDAGLWKRFKDKCKQRGLLMYAGLSKALTLFIEKGE